MCTSSSSVSSSTDLASQMVAAKQAQIGQQAATKAAAIVLDTEKDSGTRLIESLIKSANATNPAAADGSVDVLA